MGDTSLGRHTENTPPLWYVLEWAVTRLLGTGAVALRLLSACAGIATVLVAGAIGRELSGRRAAIAAAALVAVESAVRLVLAGGARLRAVRAAVALAMLCFLRALADPTPRRLAAFASTASLALLSHYFAVFLLAPMIVLLLGRSAAVARRGHQRPAVAARGLGFARLLACADRARRRCACAARLAQGGHGAQWIGEWALSSRLEAIPQYYLTGYSGAPLGHGIELLVAAMHRPGSAGGDVAGARPRARSAARCSRCCWPCAASACRSAWWRWGADYLAPRNLVAAMIPVRLDRGCRDGAAGPGAPVRCCAALIAIAFLVVSVDVDLSPRLQRGDWRGVARALGSAGGGDRVITTVELGAAPLEYYVGALQGLAPGATVNVSEIDETGYAPLRASAGQPPAPGFSLRESLDINGLIVYRFLSPVPRSVSEQVLREHVITEAHPEVLVPARGRAAS